MMAGPSLLTLTVNNYSTTKTAKMDSSMAGMMSGMGMDMSSASLFQPVNKYISRLFWYLITAVVAIGLLGNILSRVDAYQRYVNFKIVVILLT
jgi:hypothetical protein